MRTAKCLMVLISVVTSVAAGGAFSASAKTVDAGDATTSWAGTGEVHDLSDGTQSSMQRSKE
jgi:hypothetical protein